MSSFVQTEPSTDLLQGSWGITGEGPQNFQDFSDNGSSHSGEGEEYVLTSGQNTPRGYRLDQSLESRWNARTSPNGLGGQAMSRVDSSRSNGSSLSQSSHLSFTDNRGNTCATQSGPHGTSGMGHCQLLGGETNAVPSQMYWPDYALDIGIHADSIPFSLAEVSPMHVVPAQILPGVEGSPPGSWGCFSNPVSRTPSPVSVDGTWPTAPLSPESSPEMQCLSASNQNGLPFGSDDFIPDPSLILPAPLASRRQITEGESARDHDLYKRAKPQADGLFHCPWEGKTGCNHKPEKLKCNYDKFVDSHLKPYRCKVEACEGARFSSTACLLRHEREAHGLHGHGDKPFLCEYPECDRSMLGNGFPRQWNLRDHMKRVHNDTGSTGTSPPFASTVAATKGRKRKTDGQDPQSTSNRKASLKVMPPMEIQPPPKPLIDLWMDHRHAAEDLLRGLGQPEDEGTLKNITEAQTRLNAMLDMASEAKSQRKGRMAYNHVGRGYSSTG